jgi:site-specific recombinase XerD
LAANTINQHLAAVRRLAHEAADAGLLSPDLAAGIARVKGVKQLGQRSGNWLTQDQSSAVLRRAHGESIRAKRDCAMLAILFGCGLRRAELAGLETDDIQTRQGHWAIVDLIGKGGHIRTVPIPQWAKQARDEWISAAGVTNGKIFRAVARSGKVWGSGISENVVWYVVRQCCKRVGLEHIAPHDLRRTCAKLCHANGGELEQIQFLLGHASVLTTERYLGCKQNLGHPVNDLFNLSTDTAVDENGAQSDQAQPWLRFEPLQPNGMPARAIWAGRKWKATIRNDCAGYRHVGGCKQYFNFIFANLARKSFSTATGVCTQNARSMSDE